MKPSAKVMSIVMALFLTSTMVPQASAQTGPAATPAQQQTQVEQQPITHRKAKGSADGAAVGAVVGNAATVIGAAHSHRQHRRSRLPLWLWL